MSGEDLLQVERAHASTQHLVPFGRLSLSYAKDPLVLRLSDGTESKVVANQAGVYGSVGFSLWERAHVALLLPIHFQSGEGVGNGQISGAALGDLGLDLRYALLRRGDPIELALAARLLMPTGSEADLVGDGAASLAVRGLVSREFGENGPLVTGSVGTNIRDANDGQLDTSSELSFALGGLLPLAERWAVGLEGTMASQFDRFFAGTATPASVLAGVHYRRQSWVARLGAGPGVTQGVGSPDFRVVAVLGSAVGQPAEEVVHEEKVGDMDSDGIVDPKDACPSEPEDRDGLEDEDGCPDLDDDADGIPDTSDKCPRVPEDKDGFEDPDGCAEDDNDQDQVLDASDQCPVDAEDRDGWNDEDGCPEPDDDADGIPDASDQCPREKETPNGIKDEDGCPDLLRVERAEIRTLEPIYFERGKARIQERSFSLLDEMAAVISGRSDLGVIAIEGHTDDLGSNGFNMRLSQQRAEAVKTYLVERGVPADRLTARGFGESRPLENNRTNAGRERNRRVEFRMMTEGATDDASTKGDTTQ